MRIVISPCEPRSKVSVHISSIEGYLNGAELGLGRMYSISAKLDDASIGVDQMKVLMKNTIR